MALNFRMSVQQNYGSLSLRLVGDFDGTSAHELLNVLADRCDGMGKAVIDTKGLQRVYPFGVDTFHKNLHVLKGAPSGLVFTGEKASNIAPERKRYLSVRVLHPQSYP
jgi:anti-anti-sigma regulatory factor